VVKKDGKCQKCEPYFHDQANECTKKVCPIDQIINKDATCGNCPKDDQLPSVSQIECE